MKELYQYQQIEPKWQEIWQKDKIFEAKNFDDKPKKYILIEFPYPSGKGLHIGHCRPYTALDILARKSRMEGFNVLFPFGWDAFGLPTENYAIKTGIHPAEVTKKNTDNFRFQAQRAGFSFDWSREINTTDSSYYKWTQWIFLQLYKNNLAYKKKMPINWCPSCKIGLANEEVVDGKCERCGADATKKTIEQWMLKITAYADKLLDGLADVDYLPQIKEQQINWIGRSEGAEVKFKIKNDKLKINNNYIKVFTTRPDTLFGVTFLILAPEHDLVGRIVTKEQKKLVKEYVNKSISKSNIERQENKEKTGVFTGSYVFNPINNQPIPVWIADYVLPDYGTGAIMAVPAHDQRDHEFAQKFDLPIKEVIIPKTIDQKNPPRPDKKTVFRRSVQAIVIDPKTQKLLCLKWKKHPWTTFVVGGVEDGEDLIEAATREIGEETGLQNIKYIRTLGGPVQSNYFATHKDENRQAVFSALVFEASDDKKITSISQEEKDTHEISWMSWDEMAKDPNLCCSEFEIWRQRYFGPDQIFSDYGVTYDCGQFDNLESDTAIEKIIQKLVKNKSGSKKINFKLRDWVFSRQRYWGEPIPIVYCDKCGTVPLPENELPLVLPNVKNYQPTDNAESPLAAITDWVNTTCPTCQGPARRETDTMPNWAGSSWYYLRYSDPHNSQSFADMDKLKYWTPVDIYNGGMEHVTLHLLYSRFWHQFLYDMGHVPTPEPYQKRIAHGMVLAEGGEKMSKSKGNVIDPMDVIDQYGADSLRGYEMFMGPYPDSIAWDTNGLKGVHRFLQKVYQLSQEIILVNQKIEETPPQWIYSSAEIREVELATLVNKNIQKISRLYDDFSFNTVISNLMIFVNDLNVLKERLSPAEDPIAWRQALEALLLLLAPACPHICEELWHKLGHTKSICLMSWPKYDEKLIQDDVLTVPIQVNGKRRDEIVVPVDLPEKEVLALAKEAVNVKKFISGKKIVKEIYIPGKIINIVIK